jgi:hypothetical protein
MLLLYINSQQITNRKYDVLCPDDDYDMAEARQREAERQENVKKTLQMIEDALGY